MPDRASRLLTREGPRYALALLGYIGLGILTKHYLTFTWGIMYFILVLEVLPRTYRRLRGSGDRGES
ncbi:hypothetical protein [Jatrophihabitans sp.]|uniref:hypothetical protein n=1 Tax=Jatrophihabitans sp. TaxID=1932789 RepID=UPI0030C6B444|nr:hypothetical protein [Jatrophihabitans sp.]